MENKSKKIAILTAGGLAPCLNATIGSLIKHYSEYLPSAEIICFKNGYAGVLTKDYIKVSDKLKQNADLLLGIGGSVIGNSRVKLTNVEDCRKRGLVGPEDDPLEIAAINLSELGIDILHPIGGDDTSLTAASLAEFLKENGYNLTVVGLPKTIDNDIYPIAQTMGALTAAEAGANFFLNVVNEITAAPKTLIIHEVMGRNCGYLTAKTAEIYQQKISQMNFIEELGWTKEKLSVDAILIPEEEFDVEKIATHLKTRMEKNGCVKVFISEGAGAEKIAEQMEKNGEKVPRDAFGHIKLDKINVGENFGKQIKDKIGAERVLVQKSGYFARSAAPNEEDLRLIYVLSYYAVYYALHDISGIMGEDLENSNYMDCISFDRIKGGKKFDVNSTWFVELKKSLTFPT